MTETKTELKPLIIKQTLDYLAKLTKLLNSVVRAYLSGSLAALFDHVTYSFRINLHSVTV